MFVPAMFFELKRKPPSAIGRADEKYGILWIAPVSG
jgi:hypothetical protein